MRRRQKISGEDVVIYAFIVLVVIMLLLAFYGYTNGRWTYPQ